MLSLAHEVEVHSLFGYLGCKDLLESFSPYFNWFFDKTYLQRAWVATTL